MTETLREMLKRVSGVEPTNEVLDAIEQRVKNWLEDQRPKNVESTDEIIVNNFIDYLVSTLAVFRVTENQK